MCNATNHECGVMCSKNERGDKKETKEEEEEEGGKKRKHYQEKGGYLVEYLYNVLVCCNVCVCVCLCSAHLGLVSQP